MSFFMLPAVLFQSLPPIVTDRPDFTESAVVVPAGTTQIEGGVTHTSARPDTSTSGPELLIRHSLNKSLEARLSLPDYNVVRSAGHTERGWGDANIGVKLQFGPTANGTDIGLILGTSVPTGANAFTSDLWEPEFKLCAGRDIAPGTSLSAMLAGQLVSRDRLAAWQMTLSLGREIGPNSGFFLEYAGNFMAGSTPLHIAHAGFVFQPWATSQWDVHFGCDISNPKNLSFVGFGYAVRY